MILFGRVNRLSACISLPKAAEDTATILRATPQTLRLFRKYYLESQTRLSSVIPKKYENRMTNTSVYLQNSLDYFISEIGITRKMIKFLIEQNV
jgi:hypothetical protein